MDKANEQLSDYEEKLDIVEQDSIRLREEFDAAKDEYERIEGELERFNQLIDDIKNEIHEKKLTNQRYEGEINVVSQQILSYKQGEDNLNEQIDKIKADLDKFATELKGLFEEKAVLDEKLDNADDVLDEATTKNEALKNKIINEEDEIENSKSEIIEFLNEGGTLKAKVGRYDTMLENINLRKTQLNQRFLENKSDEEKYNKEKSSLEQELSNISKELETINNKLEELNGDLDANNSTQQSLKNNITSSNNQIVSLKSKKEALRNLTERYDGYGNSIRKVMEQKTHNSKIIGVVADIIDVDKRYETAIETALGGSIQNIVTEDEDTAKKLIEFLKQNKFGRATFLPISSIVDRGSVNKDVTSEQGVVGVAASLVKCDAKYNNLVSHLLGRSVVVDNIDNAIKLSRKYKQSLRIVTLEGELINPGGAMTGGAFKNSSNLLGRKRELDEIDEEIKNITAKLADMEQELKSLSDKREVLKNSKEEHIEKQQQLNIKINTYSLNLEQVLRQLEEVEKSFAGIGRENNELAAQIKEINANKEELFSSNKKQEEAVKTLEAKIEELEKQIVKDKADLEKSTEEINKLNIDFNTVKQQYDFVMVNIKRVRTDETESKESLESLKLRLNTGAREIAELSKKIDSMRDLLEENNRIITIKEQRLVEMNEEKTALNATHKDFFNKREALSEQINGLDKSAFKLNASIEKISEQSENLNNYMWEEYELTYNSAMMFKDDEFTDISSLKREISAVKGKIKQLGDVNVNAIEDYKSVSERYEFLKAQHDDITKAEENLVSIIAELDRAMREQFAEKFKEIRIMFAKVFKELFGGGKADLELVDEDDILETGIKINAQPPGKKLQNMMQLSGGEKSLTAIALLFAIQSLKPSPFCLLDEIEAALDDSNVKRFAKYLNKLTKDTQFIVITHRKGTMEAADILYGITMQEKGVSTLVSVNMIEGELDD